MVMKRNDYSPKELYEILSKSVIGQDTYLKKIAVTVWLHNKRITATEHENQKMFPKTIQKHNLLCIGPTGSGKTLALNTLAKLYNMDLLVYDAASLTGTGWKGNGVEDILAQLLSVCGDNITRTERAIVVLDEIDKMILSKRGAEPSFCAEHSLLKMIEGNEIKLEIHHKTYVVNTKNILFIGAGAFEGIEQIVQTRIQKGKTIGFEYHRNVSEEISSSTDEPYLEIKKEDIIAYGMGAQLVGRFSDIAILKKLEVNDLVHILLNSDVSVVKSLNTMLLNSCGISVSIDEKGAQAVARQAYEQNTGARGLEQIIVPVLNDVLFLLEDDKDVNEIRITEVEGEEPGIKLFDGPRKKKLNNFKRYYSKTPYSFPNRQRKNVEHFVNHIIGPSIYRVRAEYKDLCAIHALLCSIVYFVIDECMKKEHTLDSVVKILIATRKVVDERSTYEIMISRAKKTSAKPEYQQYYERYISMKHTEQILSMAYSMLEHFMDAPSFTCDL